MGLTATAQAIVHHREKHPIQQFGQTADASTINGSTGCTHTGLQEIDHIWTGRWSTHDQISRLVGYSAGPQRRGLRPTEVAAFASKRGLPYSVRSGLTADAVLALVARGPVGFGMAYSWVPEWRGARYNGKTADGKPNGWAHPLGKAGKTQLSGFTGAHFGLVLAYDPAGMGGAGAVYVLEPNHNSPSRPEKPPYDVISRDQFRRLYGSYKTALGRNYYAVVPTKTIGRVF